MGVKERILAIKLMEKVKERPQFAKEIGLDVAINNRKEKSCLKKG